MFKNDFLNSDSEVHIEDLKVAVNCDERSHESHYITIHFISKWKDGDQIASTYERGVPIEIQIGTKMLAPGLDNGLKGMCVGDKRRITLPASLGWMGPKDQNTTDTRKIEYEVELVNIADQTTINTFKYLDLNNDNRVSQEEAEALVNMFMKALTTDIPGVDTKYLVTFFMSLHDRDNDSYISEKEFLDSLDSFRNLSRDEL